MHGDCNFVLKVCAHEYLLSDGGKNKYESIIGTENVLNSRYLKTKTLPWCFAEHRFVFHL